MNKKILYLFFAAFLALAAIKTPAEEQNVEQLINSTTMPTDEEIRATIQKFHFDKAQEEYLFKETKKKLTEMYSDAQTKKLPETSNPENIIPEFFRQESEKQAVEDVKKSVNTQDSGRAKKYSNHDPLFPKKSYGARKDN